MGNRQICLAGTDRTVEVLVYVAHQWYKSIIKVVVIYVQFGAGSDLVGWLLLFRLLFLKLILRYYKYL